MIRSMTGFGQGSAEHGGVRATVDLRSVNHRFVEARLRLPAELSAGERELRNRVLDRVRRGRVDGGVGLEVVGESAPALQLNEPLAHAVFDAARVLAERFGGSGVLDVGDVIRVPQMFVERPAAVSPQDAAEAARRALDAALEALDADRLREGGALVGELVARVRGMRRLLAEVSERAREVPQAARRKLEERIRALAPGVELDPGRLAQEVAYLADRADITEETVRLASHLEHAERLLAEPDGEPVGKRLDFLAQEIPREVNTLHAKSADLEIGTRGLALKADTEKLREQIQNLE